MRRGIILVVGLGLCEHPPDAGDEDTRLDQVLCNFVGAAFEEGSRKSYRLSNGI